MKMKVGFIGLGIMGKAMSKNLLKAGYELVVLNTSKNWFGACSGGSLDGLYSWRLWAEQVDVIITMLPNSPQVNEKRFWARMASSKGLNQEPSLSI